MLGIQGVPPSFLQGPKLVARFGLSQLLAGATAAPPNSTNLPKPEPVSGFARSYLGRMRSHFGPFVPHLTSSPVLHAP